MASKKDLNLASLPYDVLSPITDLLSAHAIGKLWFCGNNDLHRSLAMSVQRFRLEYAHTERFFKSLVWPRLLARFMRLNDLEIIVPPAFQHYSVVREVDFAILSPVLRHCRLKFANAWLELVDSNTALVTPSNELRTRSRPDLSFKDRFFNLETLEANNFLSDVALDADKFALGVLSAPLVTIRLPEFPYRPNDINSLRDTVTELHCNVWDGDIRSGAITRFPSSLTHLRIKGADSSTLVRLLPATVIHLHLDITCSPLTASEDFKLLPPSLTYLEGAADVFEVESMSQLSQELRTLVLAAPIGVLAEQFESLDWSWNPFLHLPPRLETLDRIYFNNSFGYLHDTNMYEAIMHPVSVLELLPRSLRNMLTSLASLSQDQSIALPPSLTALSCELCQGVSESVDLSRLSSTLTDLNIVVEFVGKPLWRILAPLVSLKKLSLSVYLVRASPDNPVFPGAEVDLCSLLDQPKSQSSGAERKKAGTKFEGPFIESLTLKVAVDLTALHLGHPMFQQLKTLCVQSGFLQSNDSRDKVERWISDVPQTLRSLELSYPASFSIDLRSLFNLPRSLTFLHLPSVNINDKTDFAVLPPLLTGLELSSPVPTLLTLKDLEHWLPRQLTSLRLPKSHAVEPIDAIDFRPLEEAMPFLRGRVVIPPLTGYSFAKQKLRSALERHGKTFNFVPTYENDLF